MSTRGEEQDYDSNREIMTWLVVYLPLRNILVSWDADIPN
jgi:hypothetical protein